MIRICECGADYAGCSGMCRDFLVLDEMIWQKGREYFIRHKGIETIPIYDKQHKIFGYAWQDQEADREIRMLRELDACDNMIDFKTLYPKYTGVTIHGCNELAWYMAKYLLEGGMFVNVEGELWRELGIWEEYDIPVYENYDIYAEGIHQRSSDWKKERLRSVSVEFECINEIYEENIKAGMISDADGDSSDLLRRLREEKEIVIRGTGTKAQDAYDWLMANGIAICAFQSDRPQNGRKNLFGVPILKKREVMERFQAAVVIECGAKHSAWGFGDVNSYDYEGYKRNERYILLRDYIEVPENNLENIVAGKKLVLMGDIRLCSRAYKWFRNRRGKQGEISYWDILEENGFAAEKFGIPIFNKDGYAENSVYMLIYPEYYNYVIMTEETAKKRRAYIEKIEEYEVYDYTDYFSDQIKFIHLETEKTKFRRKELCPKGILIGAIPPFSGNVLIRSSFSGHPQILTIDGGKTWNCGNLLESSLYSFCVRLAEEKAIDIPSAFWSIYQQEAGKERVDMDFPFREKFDKKMSSLLAMEEQFTSQELFILFELAYAAMFQEEDINLENAVIYWEPHGLDRKCVKEFAWWLQDKNVKGFTLCTTRNSYIHAGSAMRLRNDVSWVTMMGYMYSSIPIPDRMFGYWEERTIKFEELKCRPREILTELCEWLGIDFCDTLMETTFRGEKIFYFEVTGFDTKPAYNLYEEYFSVFDRMRICLLNGAYQKQYGYPFVSCLSFSRREVRDMFLKKFRWETQLENKYEKSDWEYVACEGIINNLLWRERFAEIMEAGVDEVYGM